jgi:hypothetical protein
MVTFNSNWSWLIFLYPFDVCFLVLYLISIFSTIFCVLYFLYILPPFAYSCLFPTFYKVTKHCHVVETQWEEINAISYNKIS